MDSNHFKTLLRELDAQAAAQHSTINHHADGMDYLCLHRSDDLTVKLYFIDPIRIAKQRGSYLVTPHTHRYDFSSTVLFGNLRHARFKALTGRSMQEFSYAPETRGRHHVGHCDLIAHDVQAHDSHCNPSYWVRTDEIHTLLVPDAFVILGLVQFRDIHAESAVYIPAGDCGALAYPESRRPEVHEVKQLQRKALALLQ